MASCPKLAEGQVVRVTRIDSCGNPVVGAGNAFVDDCWASVSMAVNIDEGTDISFKSMSGGQCGFKKGCPTFNGFDVTGTFFSASPELIDILTGQPLVTGYDSANIGFDNCSVACSTGFALEIWQNVIGAGCAVGQPGQWFYWLLPWLSDGRLGDIEVGQDGVTFELTASTRAGGNWQNGPWLVQSKNSSNAAGPLQSQIGATCHRRGILTTITPPTAACAYVTVPTVHTTST